MTTAAAQPDLVDAGPRTIELQATVINIRFGPTADSGYTVAQVEPAEPLGPPLGDGRTCGVLTVAGTWQGCARGLPYAITGRAVRHEKFGWQFEIDARRPPQLVRPSDREGLIRLLSREAVTHLGPVRARDVVDRFGSETLRILEQEPQRLVEVSGITPGRAQQAHDAWMELRASQISPETLQRLYRLGLTKWQVSRITAKFGERSFDVVNGDPYALMAIDGIGFATADGIGRRAGIGADDPRRVRAGILHVLEELTHEGHCAAPAEHVAALVMQDRVGRKKGLGIQVEGARVERQIRRLLDKGHLVAKPVNGDPGFLALATLRAAEEEIADRLAELAACEPPDIAGDWSDLEAGLVERQAEAVRTAKTRGVLVITGGPGTGKTHTLRQIVAGFERALLTVHLAAPTGKAARRMEEATEREAKTVHRLLGFRPGEGFAFGPDMPLSSGVVIVDEASMLDVELARALVAALVPEKHRLILVGDVDQLPSVGPGAVFRDVIDAGRVPVVRLVEVMRQAAGSQIVTGSHAVNRGDRPSFAAWSDRASDLKWRAYRDDDDPADIARDILRLVCHSFPRRTVRTKVGERPIDPVRDVQVLCPMRRGAVGVSALGRALADALNPAHPSKPVIEIKGGKDGGTREIRLGDRVIQTKNDYQVGVFNGETGIVTAVRPGRGLTVDFGELGRPAVVEYTAKQAVSLHLAYALTIHKSQGSEWPVVIIPVHSQHAHMWSRQLLYTGMTRAREWCVLLGTEKALGLAIRRDQGVSRWTALKGLLQDG